MARRRPGLVLLAALTTLTLPATWRDEERLVTFVSGSAGSRMSTSLSLASPSTAGLTPFRTGSYQTAGQELSRGYAVQRRAGRSVFGDKTMEGRVKSFNKDSGFGFISCEDAFEVYKRDIFLHKEQATGLAVGDRINFKVEMNAKNQPQARDVRKVKKPAKEEVVEDEMDSAWEAYEAEKEAAAAAELAQAAAAKKAEEAAWAIAEQARRQEEEAVWAEVQAEAKAEEAAKAAAAEAPAEEQVEEQEEAQTVVKAKEVAPRVSRKRAVEVDEDAQRLDIAPAYMSALRAVATQHKNLEEQLGSPEAAMLPDFAKLSATLKRLGETLALRDQLEAAIVELKETSDLDDGTQSEMALVAREELPALRERVSELRSELQVALLPRDERDDADKILVEIRPGTGGAEASLWAEDLMNMYMKYCEMEGLRFQVLSTTDKEGGGLVEASLSVQGEQVYQKLKYESGVHRVQRVPATEKADRVHTSTASVVIMPDVDEEELGEIDEKEFEIQYTKAGGKGGQNVNKLEKACRAKHIPTGLSIFMRDERSQLQNKKRALQYLTAQIRQLEYEKKLQELSKLRTSQVGSGGRSDKIRSYNYKDNRVTDHRLNMNFNLDAVLSGNLQEPSRQMRLVEQQSRLEQLERDLELQSN